MCYPCLRDRVPELEAEVERLRPYEQAIKAAHNGYQGLADFPIPDNPLAAIRELVEEARELAIAESKAEIETLQAIVDEQRDRLKDRDKEIERLQQEIQQALRVLRFVLTVEVNGDE